jgi:excisionase family DNA binding protein
MPRMRKPKPAPAPQSESRPTVVNGPPGEVLTLAEAAAYLRLPEADVVGLVHSQGLPGRFAGSEWRFLKTAIQNWLATPSSPPSLQENKEVWLSLAGKYKDDPDLPEICEEAYRRRGRPITQDE